MKNLIRIFGVMLSIFLIYSCEEDKPTSTLPVLTTTAISAITQTTATSGGNITADNGDPVTARGVCWGTVTNPTTANSKTTDGTGTGTFTSSITGLTAGTTYFVRAYATNSAGIGYGNEISFATSTLTYVISRDSSYYSVSNSQEVRVFDYNSSKKLFRVRYKWGATTDYNGRDTIYYNASGQVSKVETYYSGISTPQRTNTYNYTSGVLTSVNESSNKTNDAYVRTRSFTYSAGKILTQTVTYTSGSGSGGPENITGITYTGNNITSANLTGYGLVTLTWDLTAPNPYYGLNCNTDDFINMFNQNNILKAYLTSDPTQIFTNNTYTYTDGRVATIISIENSETKTTVLTYKGI